MVLETAYRSQYLCPRLLENKWPYLLPYRLGKQGFVQALAQELVVDDKLLPVTINVHR